MKKTALFMIILAIVACCLFPPWRQIYKEPNSNIKKYEPVGYSFIAVPPEVRAPVYSSTGRFLKYENTTADVIDFGRLGIQVSLLLFLGSCIVFSKYIFPKVTPKPILTSESPPKKKRKWVVKTITCLLIFVLVWYAAVMTGLYCEAEQKWSLFRTKYDELERKQSQLQSQNPQSNAQANALTSQPNEAGNSKIDPFIRRLMAGETPESMEKELDLRNSKLNTKPAITTTQPADGTDDIKNPVLDALLNGENVDKWDEKAGKKQNEADSEVLKTNRGSNSLKMNTYGPDIHQNQYGQPVKLRPDFGYVTGEQLQIKQNAYGLGVHMDQYGRPVREKPWP